MQPCLYHKHTTIYIYTIYIYKYIVFFFFSDQLFHGSQGDGHYTNLSLTSQLRRTTKWWLHSGSTVAQVLAAKELFKAKEVGVKHTRGSLEAKKLEKWVRFAKRVLGFLLGASHTLFCRFRCLVKAIQAIPTIPIFPHA